MAIRSACSSAAPASTERSSACCRPEEDPFLLLESSLRSIEVILMLRRGLPLRRTWNEQPYGEEEITLLEEEVLPALRHCLARVDELDSALQAQQDAEVARLQAQASQKIRRSGPRKLAMA